MTDNVVQFPPRPRQPDDPGTAHHGNGAREALVEFMTTERMPKDTSAEHIVDHLLIWLWARGYMVGPAE